MPVNVEIKAYVRDPENLAGIIYDLTDSLGSILKQEDTYFRVQNGRLKLRVLGNEPHGELLYYDRANETGPKRSEYHSTFIPDSAEFKITMEKAVGVLAVLKKCRRFYMYGNTRIHLDEVADLGCFLELEVELQPHQSTEDGEKIAKELMAQLGVQEDDLIAVGYMDLFLQRSVEQNDTPTAVANGGIPQDATTSA